MNHLPFAPTGDTPPEDLAIGDFRIRSIFALWRPLRSLVAPRNDASSSCTVLRLGLVLAISISVAAEGFAQLAATTVFPTVDSPTAPHDDVFDRRNDTGIAPQLQMPSYWASHAEGSMRPGDQEAGNNETGDQGVQDGDEDRASSPPGQSEPAIKVWIASDEREDWQKAITTIRDLAVSDGPLARGEAAQWVVDAFAPPLGDLDARRDMFWAAFVLQPNVEIGLDVLVATLSDPRFEAGADRVREFRRQALEEVTRRAREEAAAERLFLMSTDTPDSRLFEALFPIIVDIDPKRAGDLCVRRATADPSTAEGAVVDRARALFLETYFVPPDRFETFGEWWIEVRDEPIVASLRARADSQRRSERHRDWVRSTEFVRTSPRFGSWLRQSLDESRVFAIRRDALTEIEAFAFDLHAEAPVSTDSELRQRIDGILKSVLRLLRDESNGELRVAALQALAEMRSARSDDAVIQRVVAEIPNLTSSDSDLRLQSVAALRAIARLYRPPGTDSAALEQVRSGLSTLVESMQGGGSSWGSVETASLLALLEALSSVGPEPSLVSSLEAIFEQVESVAVRQSVFDVLRNVNRFSDAEKREVLQFFARLVKSDEESVRAFVPLAINGIDYLRLEEGLPILSSIVLSATADSEWKNRAIRAIADFGSAAAAQCLHDLRERSTDDAARSAIADAAKGVVVDDATFSSLIAYAFKGPQPSPWFDALMRDSAVKAKLRVPAGHWNFEDSDSRDPEAFARWFRIQKTILERGTLLANRADTTIAADLSLRGELAQRAKSVVDAVVGEPQGYERESIEELRTQSVRRQTLLERIVDGDLEQGIVAFREVWNSSVVGGPDSFLRWFLSRVSASDRPADARQAFRESIRQIVLETEGYTPSDDVADLLNGGGVDDGSEPGRSDGREPEDSR